MKKIVSMLLVLALLLSCVTAAFAADTPFSQTAIYSTICGSIDDSFSEYEHSYEMDDELNVFYIFINAPAGWASVLETYGDQVKGPWNDMTGNMTNLGQVIHESLVGLGYQIDAAILLLSDKDPGTALFICLNDQIVFDILNPETGK